MNGTAHPLILNAAIAVQPEPPRAELADEAARNPQAANYPDIFDDPTRTDEARNAVDPDWRRFCRFPDTLEGSSLHTWPYPNTESARWRPVVEYWLRQSVEAWRMHDLSGFVKFVGCLSHFFGDKTQAAHLVDLELLAELVPTPPSLPEFHYHTDLEAVTGVCGTLRPPRLLGLGVSEAAWSLTAGTALAMRDCRRYIVPTLQSLFGNERKEACRWAGPPMTAAAQLTADAIYTACRLATREIPDEDRQALAVVDLRTWPAMAEKHDSVYGGIILDGNRSTPPSGAPIVPAKLRFADGSVRQMRGMGVLPHSGMNGSRDCWMRYEIPAGVFSRFEALVGMNVNLVTDGAVDFIVELGGRVVFHSGRRTASDPVLAISIPLAQETELTLKVADTNEGKTFWNNHAFWGEPRLTRA